MCSLGTVTLKEKFSVVLLHYLIVFLLFSQAALYKKSPPSEADCLLLALELLYVWRAFYTCSETVLNRILSGERFVFLWASPLESI